jgi:predicted O-methyltransferase YrrM
MQINRGDMLAYAESYVAEDFYMQQARKNGAEVGAIDPTAAVGNLIKYLIKSAKSKSVVEIGTGSGVGGLWIFAGLNNDGVLTTIDTEREFSKIAKQIFQDAEIAPTLYRIITGNLIEVVDKLADNNYDFVVARCSNELPDMVHAAARLLKVGGIFLIDAVMAGGKVADATQRDSESIARRDAIKLIQEDKRWNSTLLPIGAGVLVAHKLM